MLFNTKEWTAEFDKKIVPQFLAIAGKAIAPITTKPPKLFHYTNSMGMKGIISSGRLRASHIYYMMTRVSTFTLSN